MPSRLPAPLLLIAASVLWSLGGVLIKSIDWNPLAIAGMRSAIAALVVACFAGWPRRPFSQVQRERPSSPGLPPSLRVQPSWPVRPSLQVPLQALFSQLP